MLEVVNDARHGILSWYMTNNNMPVTMFTSKTVFCSIHHKKDYSQKTGLQLLDYIYIHM